MEIRGQARSSGIGMPQSMGYNQPPQHDQESPAKLPSASISSTLPERSEHGGHSTVISPNQTLDRHNLTHHQHQHHQLNLHLYRDHDQQQQQLHHHQQQQQQQQQRVSDDSPDADLATTPVASATIASPSNSKTVPSSQPRPQPTAAESSNTSVRYRECLKNHAASMGGHVLDGCGEFMPSGEEGTPEALRCAACDCHRNFHRKEVQGEQQTGTSYYSTYHPSRTNYVSHRTTRHQSCPHTSMIPPQQQQHKYSHSYTNVFGGSTPPTGPMMMAFGGNNGAPAESSSEDLNMFQSDTGQQAVLQSPYSMSKKRFRTKFTQQQKDKMHDFAQKLGWRIQKQDEQEVHQFCEEVGVKRQVFKVWMHNNKQAMKKKEM